jgi:hypothetical protein
MQFGRCFVFDNKRILATGTCWEQTLENLLSTQVVEFIQQHSLVVPDHMPFLEVMNLYLTGPDEMIDAYSQSEALVANEPVEFVYPKQFKGMPPFPEETDETRPRGTLPSLS